MRRDPRCSDVTPPTLATRSHTSTLQAMEQQTISITKAGIQATLNARTSILAAANPLFGRYDRTKTLRQNVTISAPIMSRFDLFYVVLDEMDEVADRAVAEHIVDVHQRGAAALTAHVAYPMELLQAYVRYAKALIRPEMDDEAKRAIINSYKLLRQSDALNAGGSSYRVTVRQLESLIRLSEALARLHLDSVVRRRYVHEAYRLLKSSMLRVDHPDVPLEDDGADGVAGDLLGGDFMQDDDFNAAEGNKVPDDEGGAAAVAGGDAPPPQSKQPATRTLISEDVFERMRTFFAVRIREAEEVAASERAATPEDDEDGVQQTAGALPFGSLIDYWVDARRDAEETEGRVWDEAAEDGERLLARKVLRKLLRPSEGVLYVVKSSDVEEQRWIGLSADFVIEGVE